MQQQLAEMEKKPNMLAFKTALAFSIYFLVLIYVFKMLGINQNNVDLSMTEKVISSLLSYIPFILAVVYVQTTHKKELGGYITFGRAFSAGFRVASYSGLFIALILIIYYTVLDRNAFEEIMNVAIDSADGDENKIKGIEMMRSYMVYFIGFTAAITYTFFGLIISLIGAAVIKKIKPLDTEY